MEDGGRMPASQSSGWFGIGTFKYFGIGGKAGELELFLIFNAGPNKDWAEKWVGND
jgi:hypothetical protein